MHAVRFVHVARSNGIRFGHLILFLAFVSLFPFRAYSWGPAGHRIVARIAAQHCSPEVHKRIRFRFGENAKIEDVAMWADDIRPERPETAPWHYINIAPGSKVLDLTRDCPGGDCVTVKIREFVGIIRLGIRERAEIDEALKFVIHLVADLHQPLHAGLADDRGGNGIPVILSGEETNLHKVWDSALVDRLGDEDDVVARLVASITPQKKRAWQEGNPRTWTWETHQLALSRVYGPLPQGTPPVLGDDYMGQAGQLVEEQLAKAGVRLAQVLDVIWP